MFGIGILSGLLVLPIVGALCIGALRGEHEATLRSGAGSRCSRRY